MFMQYGAYCTGLYAFRGDTLGLVLVCAAIFCSLSFYVESLHGRHVPMSYRTHVSSKSIQNAQTRAVAH
jgi:hypothetical protein